MNSHETPDHPQPDIDDLFGDRDVWMARLHRRATGTAAAGRSARRTAVLLAAVTWLPLLVLAAAQGVAWGDRVEVPLVRDFLPYGQLLVVVPILVLGGPVVGVQLARAMVVLRSARILSPDGLASLDGIVARSSACWRSRLSEVVVLAVTVVATVASVWGARDWLTGGWQVLDSRVTFAGWWYLLVAWPVIRYLGLKWVWRALLWSWMLWRLARLPLRLRPEHPDRAGGLAFLGEAHARFGILMFALGVQLSCLVADGVVYRGVDLLAFRGEMVTFVVVTVAVSLLPLLVFTPNMLRARQEHLAFLSSSGHVGAEDVRRLLLADDRQKLPCDEISALADFGPLYENARLMRPVPLELRHLVVLALAAALPFAPLVFLIMPAQEVLRTLARLVL